MKKLISLMIVLYAAVAYAGVPQEISYQGKLKEYGAPVTGTRTVNFKIYTAESGPGLVWESGNVSIIVSSGVFTHTLTPVVDWRLKDLWIETVISGKTLVPREKLTAQAFALHAKTAEGISKPAGETIDFTIGSTERASLSSSGEFSTLMNGTTFYLVPRGAIIMWAGSVANIPSGWVLCDGNNGTPDLRSRFVVGYDDRCVDYNAIGNTGGERNHLLVIDEMPSHTHYSGINMNGTSGSLCGWEAVWSSDNIYEIHTSNTGGNTAHENRPPYYVLAYLIHL